MECIMADLNTIWSSLETIGENLETYLSYDKERGSETLSVLQKVFDYNKKEEIASQRIVEGYPLDKLEIEGFDHEQLWQQIQLQNESLLRQSAVGLKTLLRKRLGVRLGDESPSKNGINVGELKDPVNQKGKGEIGDLGSNTFEHALYDSEDDGKDYCKHKPKPTNSGRPSVLDDQFFKLAEMEKFLEMEEKRREDGIIDADSDSDDIDLFTDHNKGCEEDGIWLDKNPVVKTKSDDRNTDINRKEPANYMYKDFFDAPDDIETNMNTNVGDDGERDQDILSDMQQELQNESDDESSDFPEDNNSEMDIEKPTVQLDNMANKSTFEKQQDKVKRKITELEDSNVSNKPWQLVGEASAAIRPANSLLEEVLQFDHTTVAAPDITEKTSKLLEDIITQRIKDQTWDDVERKEKPVKELYEYKKAKPLNQEKSKMSLSEIYEKEYLTQKEPVVEKENEEHTEIQKMMKVLFARLDALSNFHFTPKPPKSEVAIVANVPSITLEESAPVTVSETTLLAPEEVYDKPKVEVKGHSELSKQDRKHERRVKKKRQRLAAKEKQKVDKIVGRIKPGLGNKYSKAKAVEKLKKGSKNTIVVGGDGEKKSLTTSSAFFAKLQDSVRGEIYAKKSVAGKKNSTHVLSAQVKL